mgnify:FL=1
MKANLDRINTLIDKLATIKEGTLQLSLEVAIAIGEAPEDADQPKYDYDDCTPSYGSKRQRDRDQAENKHFEETGQLLDDSGWQFDSSGYFQDYTQKLDAAFKLIPDGVGFLMASGPDRAIVDLIENGHLGYPTSRWGCQSVAADLKLAIVMSALKLIRRKIDEQKV